MRLRQRWVLWRQQDVGWAEVGRGSRRWAQRAVRHRTAFSRRYQLGIVFIALPAGQEPEDCR